MSNAEIGIELFKGLVVKLLSIVGNKYVENPESTYNRFSKKLLDFSIYDVCQSFSFYSLGEVIDGY